MVKSGRAGRLANPATTEVQNQGYVMAHPSIHPIWSTRVGLGVRLVLWTQGSNRISRKSSSEGVDGAAETRGLEPGQ